MLGTLLAVVGLGLVRSLGAVELARLDAVRLDASVLGWSLVLSLLTGTAVGLAPALLWRGHARPFGDASLRAVVGGTAARTIRRFAAGGPGGSGDCAAGGSRSAGSEAGGRSRESIPASGRNGCWRCNSGHRCSWPLHSERTSIAVFSNGSSRCRAWSGPGFISDAFISSSPERTLTTERDGEAVSARLQFRGDEISTGLFQALGTRLLNGRLFAPRDGPESPRVVIVNDALAHRLWPGKDAVGRRFKRGPAGFGQPLVDRRRRSPTTCAARGLETEPIPQIFQPVAQNPSASGFLIIRAERDDPLEMAAIVQTAVRQLDPRAPLYGVSTLESRLRAFYAPRGFQTSARGRVRRGRAADGGNRDLRAHPVRGLDAHEGDSPSAWPWAPIPAASSGWSSARGWR